MRAQYPDFFRLADGLRAGQCDLEVPYDKFATMLRSIFGKQPIHPAPLELANVVTSRIEGKETHKVAIDLDMDAALIPSSTPGHHHLFINHELTWENYEKLLITLEEVGLIEPGYLNASITRGATVLRTPWTRKRKWKDDPPA